MSEPSVAVVILNYNGKKFLERFLPSIIQHSGFSLIFVADNGSTDDSVKFVNVNYPLVKVIENKNNFGYAQGYNEALKEINADYFVLLNSDVEVTKGWINPIIELMQSNPTIAACQPKLIDFTQRNLFEYAGASGGFIDTYCYPFCRGRLFSTVEQDQNQYNEPTEVFWATGASLFVRAIAFLEVGGLDNEYFAHMEEIDLCWRLKNVGYKIYVHPGSVVYHIGGGTLNKFSSRKTYLNFRNNLITLTKNHPPEFLFFKIIYRLILDGVAATSFLFSGTPKHFFAVIQAHFAYYKRLPQTLRKRKEMQKLPGFQFNTTCMYQGNIVFEYFISGKRKFTQLLKGFSAR
ncbi:MAG: N-acetylglucosaminyl-diphospho-decaprenol L-rhamnosyltransferase [Bacteroidetes bacterium]|nr:N-acetylglucosaminyl-diphospho-decaprenol L-rhamnosyltransferase [Bacteroidota bacterium]